MTKDVEHVFMCFSAIRYSSGENSFLALYPIFKGDIWLSGVYLLQFFVYLEYKPSVGCSVGKDLFPICWLPFCLLDSVIHLTETL